jgi:dTDP-4-amino-4,6-dideoxygalactose transaminase
VRKDYLPIGAHAIGEEAIASAAAVLRSPSITSGPVVRRFSEAFRAVNVIELVGARPVLVDIERDTLNIDPELVRVAVTPRTRAVLIMHYGGHPCEMDRIMQIAYDHRLALIEDAAHAVASPRISPRWRAARWRVLQH